jgi:hypothetical protein
LWGRLSQHRGYIKGGGGNHRGSIFRLIVGASLIERNGSTFATWRLKASLQPPRKAINGEVFHEDDVARMKFLAKSFPGAVLVFRP